jgi:hypothetical protein
MTTYEDGLLAVRFASLAPEPLPGDWADVVGRAGTAGRERLGRRGSVLQRRRRLLVMFAAIALVAVLSASALAIRAFLIDRGFIGIPPVGATASTPERGDLVLSAFAAGTSIYVYADGRLVWRRERPRGTELRASANRDSTGLLEQRLTKRGVSLLLSAAVSTGLLGRGLDLSFGTERCFNAVAARIGARLERVVWHGSHCPGTSGLPAAGIRAATPDEARALRQLAMRLAFPTSWLPPSAWRERRVHAYVPANFEVGYGPWSPDVEYSAVLSQLPAPARDALRAKKARRASGLTGWAGDLVPAYTYSYRLTTEEARSLRAALVDAGLEVDWRVDEVALAYRVGAEHPKAGAISITFDPILPHGEPGGVGG